MNPKISILCVSKLESHASPFLMQMWALAHLLEAEMVIAQDVAYDVTSWPLGFGGARVITVHSDGFLESVLDEAVHACSGEYVLRLDDDESCSPAMVEWLMSHDWECADHWKFPRMHLVERGDTNEIGALLTPHLFPDHQTRFSTKRKSGGRRSIHAGSPYGGGEVAPVAIWHHKFLVRDYAQRLAIARVYDTKGSPGYGTGAMAPFSLPEDAYNGQTVRVVDRGNGRVPWTPEWIEDRVIGRSGVLV